MVIDSVDTFLNFVKKDQIKYMFSFLNKLAFQ
jgi:hypothetical protein